MEGKFHKIVCLFLVVSFTLLSCSRRTHIISKDSSKTDNKEVFDSGYIFVEQEKSNLPQQYSTLKDITAFGVNIKTCFHFGNNNSEAIPNSPSLHIAKRRSFCKNDSCNTGYYVIGLRCPDKLSVKRWVSNKILKAMEEDSCKNIKLLSIGNSSVSDKEIADYYLDAWKKHYDYYLNHELICEHSGKFSFPTEQYGLFIMDVWKHNNLYTMCEYSYYDMRSCGNNCRTSFYTINSVNGKPLTINDIVSKKDKSKLESLLERNLALQMKQRNGNLQNLSYLNLIDGIALIKEGLLVYYYPYTIGCGAEGKYNVVFPYEQLKKNHIILRV